MSRAPQDGSSKRFHPAGVWFCGHNPGNTFGATFNTGVLYLRPTPNSVAFTAKWHAKLMAPTEDWHMEDQRGFNMLAMDGFYPTVAAAGVTDGSVVQAASKTINLMPLPARRFCSGHTFFVQQSAQREQCLNVHVTFTEGGVHGKLWRLQEAGLWNLHPKGYFDTGRYLTIRPPTIPTPYPPGRIEPYEQCQRRLAAGGEPDPTYHGWWAPKGAASAQCAKETAQYKDRNGDQGVTIDEAMRMAPRLQVRAISPYLPSPRHGHGHGHGLHGRVALFQIHTHAPFAERVRRVTPPHAGAHEDGQPLPHRLARRHDDCVATQPHIRLPALWLPVRPLRVARHHAHVPPRELRPRVPI